MSDHELRSKVIRLAHAKPQLRKDLLPVLKEGAFRAPRPKLGWKALARDPELNEKAAWNKPFGLLYDTGQGASDLIYVDGANTYEAAKKLAQKWLQKYTGLHEMNFIVWDNVKDDYA